MSIEEKLRESFSEITPPTDNGTIVKNVIERAENMDKNSDGRKQRLNRAAVTMIAAAAVLAAATVSVGAATGWSFNSAFNQANQAIVSRYDGKHHSTAEAETVQAAAGAEQAVAQSGEFDFLSGGKELDMWYTFDDFKLDIKGICADDMTAYVLFDIVFNEDFDYLPKDGWTEWETCTLANAVDEALDEQPDIGMVTTCGEGVISREDNILHCYVMPMLSNEYTMDGKTLTLDFESIARYIPTTSEKEEVPYYDKESLDFGDGGLHVEIPIDFPIFETTKWEINKPVDLSANESNKNFYGENIFGTVTCFSATPLGYRVSIEVDTSEFTKGDSYCFDMSFNVGGKTVSVAPGYGCCWTNSDGQVEYGIFTQPIDPADIDSVTICGQTFDLK